LAKGDIVHCPWACDIDDDGKPQLMARHWVSECKGNPDAKKKVIEA